MAKKSYPSREERMKDLNQRLEQGIRDVFESERFRDYLSVMSRFHTYSARNVLLIHMQRPNATRVASAKRWKEQFERFINKGEKAIYIMAPIPIVKTVERQKLDPDTKAPVLDEDGQVITEKREVQVPRFRPVPVFDVSQTNGKPLPQLAQDLTGDVEQYEAFMEALRRTAPVPMEIKPMAENLDGYFSLDEQRISIRAGMSEVQTVCAAVHEITHSILHNQKGVREDKAVRTAQELEAESVSYVVCQYCGVETGANSFGYLASWSKDKELSELRSCLATPSIRQPISSSVRLTATSPRSARSVASHGRRRNTARSQRRFLRKIYRFLLRILPHGPLQLARTVPKSSASRRTKNRRQYGQRKSCGAETSTVWRTACFQRL